MRRVGIFLLVWVLTFLFLLLVNDEPKGKNAKKKKDQLVIADMILSSLFALGAALL